MVCISGVALSLCALRPVVPWSAVSAEDRIKSQAPRARVISAARPNVRRRPAGRSSRHLSTSVLGPLRSSVRVLERNEGPLSKQLKPQFVEVQEFWKYEHYNAANACRIIPLI
ncbi:hypothetical protein NDU88_005577 [Pleurodeles waltl]|uniref:Uncharacterized protein n=1 Tax=Pleurodeles waltl TaxID=8319 RepID=A0AAV7MWR7_PLEWA|nr:hypothetical protein NDU88_005577 [Pleurodeles waltl]